MRLSPELKERLDASAKANQRTISAEIASRLEESFNIHARQAAQIDAVAQLLQTVVIKVSRDMQQAGKTPEDFMRWMREFPAFEHALNNPFPVGTVFDSDGNVIAKDDD